jgi:hypothetical protein
MLVAPASSAVSVARGAPAAPRVISLIESTREERNTSCRAAEACGLSAGSRQLHVPVHGCG